MTIKHRTIRISVLAAICVGAAQLPADVTFKPGRSEVVVSSDAPKTVQFAACEATNFLSRVLGAPVPVVNAPSGHGVASLVLGEGAFAKAAGVSVADRGRDSFVIEAKGDCVYVVGRDDPSFDLRGNIENGDGHGPLFVPGCERATLFGVYDFLERYAGCRFYFPDELGEIVPHKDAIVVPEVTCAVTPSFLVRNPYFGGDGRWFNETDAGRGRARIKSLEWLRLRMSTMDIPCCHGSRRFRYIERFAKTRPDFLALKQNGDRYDDPSVFAANQYCWSNPDFQETLYQDVKAYLTGQPAASRGLVRWGVNCRGRCVDIMPDDSFQGCWCERCQAAYRREKGPHYATELIWGVTAKIAQRLQADGVDGQICQMAYLPYGRVPDFSLPTNVHCMVADTGPWAMAKPKLLADGEARIRAWAEKLGRKIWIWTYPHKFGQTAIDGLPSMGPRAWGSYYKRMSPWIFGAFAECESERAFHNHLNYYVFSRVSWDSSTDVESVIDEYHRLMFGAAAPEMKAFYDTLETNWVYRVTGRIAETELGPVASPPSARELWTAIYSPGERVRFGRLFDAGLAKVPAGSPEARRLALVRRELLEPLEAAAAKWEKKAETVEGDVYDARLGLPLLATVNTHGKTRGRAPQTRTEIRLWRTAADFVVEWDCEEPEMDKVKCIERPDDDKDIWLENGVECWINPSDDGRTVYHLILTSKGSLFDRKCLFDGLRAQGDVSWSSRAKRHVERTEKGWKARLEIPLASLPWIKNRFRANFCRDRNVEGSSEYVQTSRFAEAGYNDFENYGTVIVPEISAAQGDVTFVAGRSEVVVVANAPKTVRFAACEATNFLSRVLGAPVPVVDAPSGHGVSSLVLGENEWSRSAGVTFDSEKRDAFAIAAKGGRVYVVGRDDPKVDPFRVVQTGSIWLMRFERATLFGVYEFFERYAGCRFFFPGEYGTILPKADAVRVPEGTIRRAPYFTSRNPYMGGDGLWHEDHPSPKAPCSGKALNWMRLRLETENAPCCHGSRNFRYIERFAKTHPEYLALKKDGSRWDDPKVFAAYQLCWSDPGLMETMFHDVKAYLTGQPAASRGLNRWGVNCVGGKYVDIMPEDSFQGCWCEGCQAAYDRTKKHYADRLIWDFTAKLARRLKEEGVSGTITQMAYMPYGDVPDIDLPDNVLVVVAQPGPWSVAKAGKVDQEAALFKAWKEKTGRRVQTWTYPHKFGPTAIPGVPDVAPRAFGAYWKRVAPYVCGGFLESEAERAIYSYLNYYVFSKVAWDPSVDVEALLSDHNRKMFGAGADEMGAFFRTLEVKWIREIVGNVADTPLGPVARVPPEHEIWTRVYSPSVIRNLAGNCERAAKAAGEGTDEACRVVFIRDQFLRPLADEAKRYLDLVSVEQEQSRRREAGAVANLVPEADFSEDIGRGGCRVWSSLRRDTETFVSAPSSGRLSHTNRLYAIRYFRNGELKPNTRYRVSYFLKLKDVKKHGPPHTGVHMAFSDGMTETRFPSGSALDGTIDWIHQSFEVKTGGDVEKLKKGLVCLRLMDASGTVWLDDVQITEIK